MARESRMDSLGLNELKALAAEPDPEFFFRGLLLIARRQEQAGKIDVAAALYSHILEDLAPQTSPFRLPEIAHQAAIQLEALKGRGKLGNRAEGLLLGLYREAMHPAGLASFALGSAAYSVFRSLTLHRLLSLPGANALTRGFGAKLLAGSAGLSMEISSLTLGSRLLDPVDRSAIGSEWASNALLLSCVRMLGGLSRRPSLSAMGGVFLAQSLQVPFGLKEKQDWGELLTNGLATWLQFQVGGELARRFLGPGFARLANELQWRSSESSRLRISSHPGASSSPLPALTPSADRSLVSDWTPSLPSLVSVRPHHSYMKALGDGPPPFEAAGLKEYFSKKFPAPSRRNFSAEVLNAALEVRERLPDFHRHLLEALASEPDVGSKAQLYRVLALKEIFKSNPLKSTTGSFELMRLQFLIGRILAEDRAEVRVPALVRVLEAMESGMDRPALDRLYQELPYGEGLQLSTEATYSHAFYQHHLQETVGWEGYSPEAMTLLFNFIHRHAAYLPQRAEAMIRIFGEGRRSGRYPESWIDGALLRAQSHPQGELILRRLFQIFAVRDTRGKLLELADEAAVQELEPFPVQNWTRNSLDAYATQLNGTRRTAYLDDLRLARKVALVERDIELALMNPVKRKANKIKFLAAFDQFLSSGEKLDPAAMIRILQAGDSSQIDEFIQNWLLGKFSLEVLEEANYDREVADWGITGECGVCRFQEGENGEKDRIIVRQLPSDADPNTVEGRDRLDLGLMFRISGIFHEQEHWHHGTGIYRGLEHPADHLRYYSGRREDRQISEIMANLEQALIRAQNFDIDDLEIARRLGLTLPEYYRNSADRTYFQETDELKLKALLD